MFEPCLVVWQNGSHNSCSMWFLVEFCVDFWEDCPIWLDATLGTKDDMVVVVLGIDETARVWSKPSP